MLLLAFSLSSLYLGLGLIYGEQATITRYSVLHICKLVI